MVQMALNDRSAVVVETDVISSITTIVILVYILGYRTDFTVSCQVCWASQQPSPSPSLPSSDPLPFVADADHLACRPGTPHKPGQSTLRFNHCHGVRYLAT